MIKKFTFVLLTLVVAGSVAHAIDIKRIDTNEGPEIWLVEDHSNPVVSLHFAFQGGEGNDPAGKEGLANFLSGTMDEGAGSYDSEAFSKILTDKSISLSFDAKRNNFHGKLVTLKKYQDEAAEMMKLSLTEPRFDLEAVNRIRQQILLSVEANTRKTDRVANSLLREALYGDHPFARESDGTIDTVKSITPEDLRAFQEQIVTKDKLIIGLSGDVTEEEALSLYNQIFGTLPNHAALPLAETVNIETIAETISESRPVPQTTLILGHKGLNRNDPDYFAGYLVTHIMGGGAFGSRLYSEIREKRGLTYGVYSYMASELNYEILLAQMSTANETVDQAIEILRSEWQRMAAEGPTEEELEKAKRYVIGSYPLNFSTTASVARLLVDLQIYELGIDYPTKRTAFFESVTLEQAKATAARLFRPDELTIVVVGGER
jgi:zinc protease